MTGRYPLAARTKQAKVASLFVLPRLQCCFRRPDPGSRKQTRGAVAMTTDLDTFRKFVTGTMESGRQELWAVWLPAGFTSDDLIEVVNENDERVATFTRAPDLP